MVLAHTADPAALALAVRRLSRAPLVLVSGAAAPARVAALTCGADVCLADTEPEPVVEAHVTGAAAPLAATGPPPGRDRPGRRARPRPAGAARPGRRRRSRAAAPRVRPAGGAGALLGARLPAPRAPRLGLGPPLRRRGQHGGRPHLLAPPEAARRGPGPDHHPARGRIPAGRAEPAGSPGDGPGSGHRRGELAAGRRGCSAGGSLAQPEGAAPQPGSAGALPDGTAPPPNGAAPPASNTAPPPESGTAQPEDARLRFGRRSVQPNSAVPLRDRAVPRP